MKTDARSPLNETEKPRGARGIGERRELPILFSGPMALGLLADRKFVTRRLSKQWLKVKAGDRLWVRETWRPWGWREDGPITVQFQADKATMWDRAEDLDIGNKYEEWYERICVQAADECEKAGLPQDGAGCYVWPNQECPLKWRPSIFLPRWCSRILLECEEDARPERLWNITEDEAIAEGIMPDVVNAVTRFVDLWHSVHTKPGQRWEDNPEVVRVGRFRRIK